MPSIARSILAVIVGFMAMMLAVIVLTLIFVKTMGLRSGNPTPGYLFVNVIYTFLAAAAGGAVTAAIARVKPLQHALGLAVVILLMGIVSYRHYTGSQPSWYQVLMILAPPLCAIAGAWLYARRFATSDLRAM